MEHFSKFQYLTHNSEKLSVYVKCECLCNNKLHPPIYATNEHQGVGITRNMKHGTERICAFHPVTHLYS